MILNWFKLNKAKSRSTYEIDYANELIVVNKEHQETMKIIQDILAKLDEIKILVDELKEEANDGKSTGNR